MTLWHEFMVRVKDPARPESSYPVCGLCGNTGIIRTVGVVTPNGIPVDTIERFCICPNGRAMKAERENRGDKHAFDQTDTP